MNTLRILTMLLIFLFIISCGSSGGSPGDDDDDDDNDNNDTGDSINTEKLIGTPFEGKTGADIDGNFFLCGQYRTETIDEFPIKIFAAFFTESEEGVIQQGIDIANSGISFTAYELTDEWADDERVIYKNDDLTDFGGTIYATYFEFNGKIEAEKEAPDWAIEIAGDSVIKWIVAHELGHATGIRSHALIDYENDTILPLEDNSLMCGSSGCKDDSPALNDYNFMMQIQGQIMQDHLGEVGEHGGSC